MSNNFENLAWLFKSDNRNRNIIRQNIDEAAFLWKMVRLSSGPILEIGRRYGGSTILLLSAGDNRHVTSIDFSPSHHLECQKIFNDIQDQELSRLELIVADSRKPIDNKKYGFIFIDGDHSYDGVRADTYAHWPNLISFDNRPPIIVFHDAIKNDGLKYNNQINHCEGVFRFCNELLDTKCAMVIGSAGSSLALTKLTELPL